MADSTLAAIRTKVRRLTRQPSQAQFSDADIDEYVNTFIQYDFPEHLRLFTTRHTLTFYTEPNKDVYDTTTAPATDPLFNYANRVQTMLQPMYIDGFEVQLSQSREEFFNWWPFTNQEQQITGADGVTLQFTGTITGTPILKNEFMIGSTDANGNQLVVNDVPYSPTNGNLVIPNQAAPGVLDPNNDINYITGVFTVTFAVAPGNANEIYARYNQYTSARPNAVLYFDNAFTLRPVPDKVYPVTFDVYIRPVELLAANQSPELEQWWQYIAYGAAKKRLEDNFDTEGVAQILPEFQMQETLVNRRTVMQISQERSQTIYADQLRYDQGRWRSRYW